MITNVFLNMLENNQKQKTTTAKSKTKNKRKVYVLGTLKK